MPANAKNQQNAASRERRRVRRVNDGEMIRIDGKDSADHEQDQRQDLRGGEHGIQPRAPPDPEDIDRSERGINNDEDDDRCRARGERGHERPDPRRQHGRHRGHRERQHHPQQEPREKPDEGAERHLDIGVGSAGQRDTTARLGQTQHDQSHRHRAQQVRHRRSRAERRRHVGG
jgi:hypothetical protein